jgi:hypothetical protein
MAMWLVCSLSVQARDDPSSGAAQAERDAWWERLRWSPELCPRDAVIEGEPGVIRHALADGRALIQVHCFLGAYQGESIFYLETPDGPLGPLEFPQVDSTEAGVLMVRPTPTLTGLAEVDASAAKLTLLYRYRGLGDCGQRLIYLLTGEEPTLEALQLRECGTADPVPPEGWPQVPPERLRRP